MNMRVWPAAGLPGVELMEGAGITQGHARRYSEEFSVGTVQGCAREMWYRGATHRAGIGELSVITPGEIYSGRPLGASGYGCTVLRLDADALAATARDITDRHFSPGDLAGPVIADAGIAAEFMALFACLANARAEPMARQERLWGFVARLLRAHRQPRLVLPAPGNAPRAVRQAQDYLQTHCAESPSLTELAAAAGWSVAYFTRTFTRAVGLPPHAYLIRARVARAKRRLAAGVPPVEAAAEAGFYDQSHLNFHFVRLVGVTPGRYQAERH